MAKAFDRSGLSQRDVVLMMGAIMSTESAVQTAKGGRAEVAKGKDAEGDDDLFPEDGGIFIPQTFGSQKLMYGEMITSEPFDQKIFGRALKNEAGPTGSFVVADDAQRALARAYAEGKRETYFKDLAECYARLTSVGASVTGAKVLL